MLPPGDVPKPQIPPMSPVSLALQEDSLPVSHWETIAHIQSLTMSTKRMLFLLSHVAIAVLSSMTETMTIAFYPALCSLTFPAPIHPLSIIHLTDNGKYDHKACHIKYLSGSPCK